MEPLRDLTWMKHLLVRPPAEKVARKAFIAAFVVVRPTREHHNEPFRYRALVFEPGGKLPVLAVNLESDILGEYLLTLEDARERIVLDRYDREPPYAEFRNRALEEADRRVSSRAAPPRKLRRPSTSDKKNPGPIDS